MQCGAPAARCDAKAYGGGSLEVPRQATNAVRTALPAPLQSPASCAKQARLGCRCATALGKLMDCLQLAEEMLVV